MKEALVIAISVRCEQKHIIYIPITDPECPNGLNCTTPAFLSVDESDRIAPQTVAVPFPSFLVSEIPLFHQFIGQNNCAER